MLYPFITVQEGIKTKAKIEIQTHLIGSLRDPIADILARNSHLTKTQLETLLIDVLSESISGKQLKYDEKARLRLTKAKISRGAFNRTLRQAKDNVVKSLYTVILLGYLGIFESTTLDPYLEIANKLHRYIETCRDKANNGGGAEDQHKAMGTIREELEASLNQLSNPTEI